MHDYALAPDKIEIKTEMLSNYRLKIANFYNILICNVETLLETRIKTKNTHRVLEFNQSQWLKPYVEFNIHKKEKKQKKMETKMEKRCTN